MEVLARVIEHHYDHHQPAQQVEGVYAPRPLARMLLKSALHNNPPSLVNCKVVAEAGQRFWPERAEQGHESPRKRNELLFRDTCRGEAGAGDDLEWPGQGPETTQCGRWMRPGRPRT